MRIDQNCNLKIQITKKFNTKQKNKYEFSRCVRFDPDSMAVMGAL